jgi:alpha-ketoglutarate-dependent taurine dioxygenase
MPQDLAKKDFLAEQHFESMNLDAFYTYLKNNDDKIKQLLIQDGFVILKKTPARTAEDFHKIITECLQWEPSYPVLLPKKITQFIRAYFSNLTSTTQYREYIDSITMKLGPPEDSIQGPHVEGGSLKHRASLLSMCCLQAEEGSAQTGIYDLSVAFNALPEEERDKYQKAYNEYRFHSRKLFLFEHILAKLLFSKFASCQKVSGSTMDMIFHPSKMVIKHPQSNKNCIQTWPFLKNTSEAVHQAAQEVFKDRVFNNIDSTARNTNSVWSIVDIHNTPLPWSDEEKLRLFKAIFKTATIHTWSQGDILLIDNIRCGHGRMEGKETKREIIQLQCNYMNL